MRNKQEIKWYLKVDVFKAAIAQKDIKQEYLAKKLGLSDRTVSGWVNNSRRPVNEEYIPKICEELGLSREELFSPVCDRTIFYRYIVLCLFVLAEMFFNARFHPYEGLNENPRWYYPIAIIAGLAFLSGCSTILLRKEDRIAHHFMVGMTVAFAIIAVGLLVVAPAVPS